MQGRNNSVFNLITSNEIVMNSKFIPDSKREGVTWMGSVGVVLKKPMKYGAHKVSHFKFDAEARMVYIGDEISSLADAINEINSENGTISIVERKVQNIHRNPAMKLHLKDVGLHVTVKFDGGHLDVFWHNKFNGSNSHGLIGKHGKIIV